MLLTASFHGQTSSLLKPGGLLPLSTQNRPVSNVGMLFRRLTLRRFATGLTP